MLFVDAITDASFVVIVIDMFGVALARTTTAITPTIVDYYHNYYYNNFNNNYCYYYYELLQMLATSMIYGLLATTECYSYKLQTTSYHNSSTNYKLPQLLTMIMDYHNYERPTTSLP